MDPASLAQDGLTKLKMAVCLLLMTAPANGLTNAQIGRRLGIYHGYLGGNKGHISRTILGYLESEGMVLQNPDSRKWCLVRH